MLKVPNECTRRFLSVYEFRSRGDSALREVDKKIERMLNDAGGVQPARLRGWDFCREMERGTARFSSSAFVQGEFVDNVPRLPVRIINHVFPMNWRTVRADRLWGTLILRRAKTISVTHYPATSETLSYFNWNKRNFNLNKSSAFT